MKDTQKMMINNKGEFQTLHASGDPLKREEHELKSGVAKPYEIASRPSFFENSIHQFVEPIIDSSSVDDRNYGEPDAVMIIK